MQFSQLDQLENNLFDNFYKSNEAQIYGEGAHKEMGATAFGTEFKRKLFEKLGINENEKNVVLTEFGNKMWEIKKRLNNHMNYLKKKMFFSKLDDIFLQIISENKLTDLKVNSKSDKKKLLNALIFLKPFIFAHISNNNMIFDGIKILYVSKKRDNSSVKKLHILLKKIKKGLSQIIIESIRNIYTKQRYNFQIMDAFPLTKLNLTSKINYNNDTNDSFLKSKGIFNITKEEHQFSDFNMRKKKEDKVKSVDFRSDDKKILNLVKTNIKFPIDNKTKNMTGTNFMKQNIKTQSVINLDKICYFYLDRLNLSGKNQLILNLIGVIF